MEPPSTDVLCDKHRQNQIKLVIMILEQYALTEASFTLVRLLQNFDTVENADEMQDDDAVPALTDNLTLSHTKGVWIRLYSRD